MENAQIITWVLGIMAAVIGWLVLNNIQQDKKLISIEGLVTETGKKVDELKTTLNLFLKSEIDTLKELAKRSNDA